MDCSRGSSLIVPGDWGRSSSGDNLSMQLCFIIHYHCLRKKNGLLTLGLKQLSKTRVTIRDDTDADFLGGNLSHLARLTYQKNDVTRSSFYHWILRLSKLIYVCHLTKILTFATDVNGWVSVRTTLKIHTIECWFF